MKILVLEDDHIWQHKINMMVDKAGYEVVGVCSNVTEVESFIISTNPDLIISDIILEHQKCVFDALPFIKDYPTIFITASPAREYQELILKYPNTHFLVKPFHELTLKNLLDKIQLQIQIESRKKQEEIVIIDNFRHKKHIPLDTILYIESEGNYLYIYTEDKKYSIKDSLNKIQEKLNLDFIQIQRAFIVNKKHIKRIDYSRSLVYVNAYTLPIGRAYKKKLSKQE